MHTHVKISIKVILESGRQLEAACLIEIYAFNSLDRVLKSTNYMNSLPLLLYRVQIKLGKHS